ncbi:MAG: hypothetical protein AVDCRST_MAG16-2201, partial [uncultured Frankineae bacterium]
ERLAAVRPVPQGAVHGRVRRCGPDLHRVPHRPRAVGAPQAGDHGHADADGAATGRRPVLQRARRPASAARIGRQRRPRGARAAGPPRRGRGAGRVASRGVRPAAARRPGRRGAAPAEQRLGAAGGGRRL